jgi:hypothetical protein
MHIQEDNFTGLIGKIGFNVQERENNREIKICLKLYFSLTVDNQSIQKLILFAGR